MSDSDPEQVDDALPPGTRFGEFEILEVIGQGGFSIVYRAQDHSLERQVALKEYLPHALARRAQGAQMTARSPADAETCAIGMRSFINEARLLARFDHPSLLRVHRFWEDNATAYMVMPLLTGRTLRQLQRSGEQAIDEAWLRQLLNPLLDALELLHDQQVFHRDIAPDNIMIEPDGRPVLLDFGAARRVINDRREQMVTAILKPSYAPIEQYGESGTLRQGPWTDFYALGATLHFMLLGHPPAPSSARVVQDDQTLLAEQALPNISIDFAKIVDWMLALRPADRPQNAAALRAALAGQGVARSDPFEAFAAPPRASASPDTGRSAAAAAAPPAFSALPPQAPASGRPSLLGAVAGMFSSVWDALASSPPGAPKPVARATPVAEVDPVERTMIAPGAAHRSDAAADASLNDLLGSGEATVLFAAKPQALPAVDPLREPVTGAAADDSAAPPIALTVTASDIVSFLGRKVVLDREVLTLGRDPAAYSLPDPQWSRRHAELRRTPEGISIVDLGSSNGTSVNGLRLVAQRPYLLQLGALIRIGSTSFVLSLADDAGPLDLTGSELAGSYELMECLQASPKGAVHRARNKRTGREVAIKILSPDYASFPGYRERFAREATIAARLQHPHICSLADFGETDVVRAGRRSRVPFVAYEIMGGGNLSARLQGAGTIPTETIAEWLRQVADALHHAHQSGVVHGNLKPSVLCFAEASNIYVTDFAIAGPQDAGHALMGTPAYMAPEQWEGAAPQPASDQYALAVLAYQLLAGVRPYEGQEAPETRASNVGQPPPAMHRQALARQQRRFSPLASRVVERALAADPAERHPTIADFGRDLAQSLRSSASAGSGAQVFVSYRRETSSGWVAYLADQLERDHGITSFVDTLGLDGAVKFPARIQRAIENCSVFVCVLGADTLKSPYVRQEIELAFRNGKRMIPVMQEGFVASEAELEDPATQELLVYDGVKLLDRQNIYIRAAVGELAQQIRTTLGDLARPDRSMPARPS